MARQVVRAESLPKPDFKVHTRFWKTVLVKPETVEDRIGEVYGYLTSNTWDSNALAAYYKTPYTLPDLKEQFDPSSTRKLDVPKKFDVKTLYRKVHSHEPQTEKGFSTVCIGLCRDPRDPKTGGLNTFWQYRDGPEMLTPSEENVIFDHGISAWVKFSVTFDRKGKPVLTIYPVQLASLKKGEERKVAAEFKQMLMYADAESTRQIERRKRTLSRKFKSPFLYNERGYPLVLMGLRAAELLGVRQIALRYGESNITPEIVHQHFQKLKAPSPSHRVEDQRYLEQAYFLKNGRHGFMIQGCGTYH